MCVCVCVYLYLVAALGRPPIHQSKHIQTHVVLAAPPQRETETCWTSIQIHDVEPRFLLTSRNTTITVSELCYCYYL